MQTYLYLTQESCLSFRKRRRPPLFEILNLRSFKTTLFANYIRRWILTLFTSTFSLFTSSGLFSGWLLFLLLDQRLYFRQHVRQNIQYMCIQCSYTQRKYFKKLVPITKYIFSILIWSWNNIHHRPDLSESKSTSVDLYPQVAQLLEVSIPDDFWQLASSLQKHLFDLDTSYKNEQQAEKQNISLHKNS